MTVVASKKYHFKVQVVLWQKSIRDCLGISCELSASYLKRSKQTQQCALEHVWLINNLLNLLMLTNCSS